MWPFNRRQQLALPPHIPKTFSEAVRMGSEGTEQMIGAYESFKTGSYCTIGSAFIGTYGRICSSGEVPERMAYGKFIQAKLCVKYPILREKAKCPVCGKKNMVVKIVDNHLNETHWWSREEIADWVEKLETQLEASKIVAAKWKPTKRKTNVETPVS